MLVMATIEGMQREFGRDLMVKIIPNLYDNREVISQEVLGELRSQFGAAPDPGEVFEHIRREMQDALDALASERRFPVIG